MNRKARRSVNASERLVKCSVCSVRVAFSDAGLRCASCSLQGSLFGISKITAARWVAVG